MRGCIPYCLGHLMQRTADSSTGEQATPLLWVASERLERRSRSLCQQEGCGRRCTLTRRGARQPRILQQVARDSGPSLTLPLARAMGNTWLPSKPRFDSAHSAASAATHASTSCVAGRHSCQP
jgi:hypothetical protein